MNFDDLIFKKIGPILLAIIIVIISLALAIKAKDDIEARSQSKSLRTLTPLFVFFTGIFGYIMYLVLRPSMPESKVEKMERIYLELEVKGTGTCIQCHTTFFPEDMFCKTCGNQLRKKCVRCSNIILINNNFCNNCGLQLFEEKKAKLDEQIKTDVNFPSFHFRFTFIKSFLDNLSKSIQKRVNEVKESNKKVTDKVKKSEENEKGGEKNTLEKKDKDHSKEVVNAEYALASKTDTLPS